MTLMTMYWNGNYWYLSQVAATHCGVGSGSFLGMNQSSNDGICCYCDQVFEYRCFFFCFIYCHHHIHEITTFYCCSGLLCCWKCCLAASFLYLRAFSCHYKSHASIILFYSPIYRYEICCNSDLNCSHKNFLLYSV